MKPRIHLTIMQPMGYVHSLGFLDQARYARYQFRRQGAEVTIAKNRLREDAINIIFGAHLGFPNSLKQRYNCVFFNLEQLGEGGARVSQDYLDLLASSAVIDYDERNLMAYGCKRGDVPVVSFMAAPYLAVDDAMPLDQRPIDLLFFGSMNERRRALIQRIEACGWNVAMFDQPLYCDERDHFIRQAKAVFNCHFYEASRFEQARAFHTLSLGTPVVSERTERTQPPVVFEEAVSWVTDESLEEFFTSEFMSPHWLLNAHKQLTDFSDQDSLPHWSVAYEYCLAMHEMDVDRSVHVWKPTHTAVGKKGVDDYKPGWWNINASRHVQPDTVLDFSAPLDLPLQTRTASGGVIAVEAHSLQAICARADAIHSFDVHQLLCNALALLQPGGRFELDLPLQASPGADAGRDLPSLLLVAPWMAVVQTPWRWGLVGKLDIEQITALDARAQPCSADEAVSIRIEFKKTDCTFQERCMARVFDVDFGGLASDEVPGAEAMLED